MGIFSQYSAMVDCAIAFPVRRVNQFPEYIELCIAVHYSYLLFYPRMAVDVAIIGTEERIRYRCITENMASSVNSKVTFALTCPFHNHKSFYRPQGQRIRAICGLENNVFARILS